MPCFKDSSLDQIVLCFSGSSSELGLIFSLTFLLYLAVVRVEPSFCPLLQSPVTMVPVPTEGVLPEWHLLYCFNSVKIIFNISLRHHSSKHLCKLTLCIFHCHCDQNTWQKQHERDSIYFVHYFGDFFPSEDAKAWGSRTVHLIVIRKQSGDRKGEDKKKAFKDTLSCDQFQSHASLHSFHHLLIVYSSLNPSAKSICNLTVPDNVLTVTPRGTLSNLHGLSQPNHWKPYTILWNNTIWWTI